MDRGQPKPERMESPHPEPRSSVDCVDWLALVASVKGDEARGLDELHRVFADGIRLYLSRRFGLQQLEARVQETFTMLVNAIKTAELRDAATRRSLPVSIVMNKHRGESAKT